MHNIRLTCTSLLVSICWIDNHLAVIHYIFLNWAVRCSSILFRNSVLWVVLVPSELVIILSPVFACCRRFNKKLLPNKKWLREQSHEHYSKHYSIHYHFDEPLAGRMAIKDVLFDVCRKCFIGSLWFCLNSPCMSCVHVCVRLLMHVRSSTSCLWNFPSWK